MAPSKDNRFQSVTGQPETREPTKGDSNNEPVARSRTVTEDGTVPPLSLSGQSVKKTTASSNVSASRSNSTINSPIVSRESSPIRPPAKPGIPSAATSSHSRRNSQDSSPNRAPSGSGSNVPSVPSAAAVQRALSALGTPQLSTPRASEPSPETPKPQKQRKVGTGENSPRWPTSPRLKSPPPSATPTRPSVFCPRRSEQGAGTPNIFVERPTPSSTPITAGSGSSTDIESEDTTPRSGMRTPGRGVSGTGSTLETVQESSLPATPAIGTIHESSRSRSQDNDVPERIAENPMEEAFSKSTRAVPESGSESGGNRSGNARNNDEARRKSLIASNSARPKTVLPRKSFTHLNSPRAKVGSEGSVRNMTVETETVSSIPQVAVGGGAGERGLPGRTENGGSIRLKPSAETIRPKKEKKKVVRKTPSINSGTASSKADIFEAKVASAVDEANSSDSEETFVYESNPPDPRPSRPYRFHSRTPSTTSMASQADQYGGRSRQSVADGYQSMTGNKSMKFASSAAYHGSGVEGESLEHFGQGDAIGSGRGKGGSTPRHQHHHHHIGRYGRGGAGHTSLFDTDSPFPQAARSLRTTAGSTTRPANRPSSPRNPHSLRLAGTSKKSNEVSTYDMDDEGADDERTPLFNSVRANRGRGGRRPNSGSVLQVEYNDEKERGCCRRAAGWITLTVFALLLISAVVGGLLGFSKPLHDVYVKDIRNVLASEQEIMLDLHVHAVNSNLMSIQISDLDVNIFAKSKHVIANGPWKQGYDMPTSDQATRRRRRLMSTSSNAQPSPELTSLDDHTADGVDEGNDPIEDPDDSQTMLLGRIFEFDSPLIFEASPLRHRSLSSVGELRLAKPGNKTEEGGTERWEKVLQYPFELIVRGVLKYQLPLSSRVRTASIGASVIVHPDEGVDDMGNMRISRPYTPYPAGSNVVLHRAGRYGSEGLRSSA
ncbi:hypothetical protein MMC16_005294 [Acarospora aff. strigata]|nr:hypothetical protein [Acarospora aff. strigata]